MAPSSSYKPTIPAFASVAGQPSVVSFLEQTVLRNKVSHAYLFVGPEGCGQKDVATALAKCLVCAKGGCNACEECVRVDRHTHPDVYWLAPEGASGYVIDQIRTLISGVTLKPARSNAKIYILENAETLTGSCANALLKTIEEPPAGVMFILMARTVDSVLPTIASRCQSIPFRFANTEEAVYQIMLKCGLPDDKLARIAFSVTGSPEKACGFVRSADRQALRKLVVNTLGELPRDDSWDILKSADRIMETYSKKKKEGKKKASKAAVELTPEEIEQQELEEEFLSKKALKIKEQVRVRERTAQERSGMMEIIATVESVLRDVLLLVSGADSQLVNSDAAPVIARLAQGANTAAVLEALDACNSAVVQLERNVTPQLILEVMLIHCKEALCPPSSR